LMVEGAGSAESLFFDLFHRVPIVPCFFGLKRG
jgi:hypothetical protein